MPGAVPISAGGSGGSSPQASTVAGGSGGSSPRSSTAGGSSSHAGLEAASSYADLRRQEAVSPKRLYAIDARCTPQSPVTDVQQLTDVAVAAVSAGGGHVLDASHVIFPNGAITLVLILAESHLSIHTWPEENLIAIDLFSCGAIDGERVMAELIAGLRLDGASVTTVERGLPPSGPAAI
jgi:S-adenosylmethionine decarboxylase